MSPSPARAVGRRPAHAGTFYPADPDALRALVDRLLDEAIGRPSPILGDELRAALVPHAGLVFSGAVAATGWAAIAATRPDTIVLLGTDHAGASPGVAAWTDGPWHGPLGETAVDQAVTDRVLALGHPFTADDGAHRHEHSLEVQLPFIARACPEARIVALLVGSRRPGDAAAAGARLGRLAAVLRAEGRRVVIVASSDLAHYPPVDVARAVDRRVLEPILRLDGDDLGRVEAAVETSDEPGLVCGLCGVDPVRAVLAAAAETGATRGVLLAESTSADSGLADPSRTVGYAAVAFVR